MSLTEHLARAAREREGIADPVVPAPRADAGPDVTVIVAPLRPATAVEPDPDASAESMCPTCGRTGTVGLVDLHRRCSDWNCEACGTMWRAEHDDHIVDLLPLR